MKFTAPLFVASVLATSALAAAIPEVESRDISQIGEEALYQRAFVEGLVGRELSDADYELVIREPKFGKFLKGAFKIGKGLLGFRRELDMDELDARDLVELASREPNRFKNFFKKAFKFGKGLLGFRRDLDMEDFDGRDLEDLELDLREFSDFDELEMRELDGDLLEERDPLIGIGLGLRAAKYAVKGALFQRDEFEADLLGRDLDFEESLFEREYEIDELD